MKEREDRAAARVEAAQQKLLDEQEEEERAILARADRKRKREMGGTVSGSNTPNPAGDAAERWELACEVCQKNGWNIVSRTCPECKAVQSLTGRMGTMIWSAVTIVDDGNIRNVMTGWTLSRVELNAIGTRWISR